MKIAFHSNSDFLNQGISNQQFEIWLYDMTAMTLTRITTANNTTRGSFSPQLSVDGTKILFMSDSDFLSQGIPDNQNEIWLYDTVAMTFTRVTSHSNGPARDSSGPQMSADGSKIAFRSDADFLNQGIFDEQYEVWLYSYLPSSIYLPVVLKNNP
jgi:Tol biopolymer transport system component